MALCESQLDSAMPLPEDQDDQRSAEEKPKLLPNGDLYQEIDTALCESQLGSAMPLPEDQDDQRSAEEKPKLLPNGDLYQVPGNLPLNVDYRSPVSHFVPPAVEMYAARQKTEASADSSTTPTTADSSASSTPVKRKRGRPRVDKTSPEYLAKCAERKRDRELQAALMNHNSSASETGEKRKRGRPRVDKTSPEYLARKRAKELETLEKKAKREYKRRGTGDSAASSSTGDPSMRVKRKYTKRTPVDMGVEKIKGKRGRPRKADVMARQLQQPKIRVRNNLMPSNPETINLDSDDEPDLGSPSQASDSLSLDENLRALRHIHEKYANIDKDDEYEAHLLTANFKKPPRERNLRDDDEVLSIRSSEGPGSVKDVNTRIEKLEDSSNSDSDSSSSDSDSSSSGSSSSSSSDSSSSDSDSDSDNEKLEGPQPPQNDYNSSRNDLSLGAWSNYSGAQSDSSDSDPERQPLDVAADQDEISESENESPDKSFQCHICGKWYSTRVTLKIHRRVHQNKGGGGASRSRAKSSDRYECDCCNATFSRRDKLWNHKAEEHRGSMTVRCDVCRKCFEDDSELAAHDKLHTADERAGRCSDCGLTFPRFELLRRHRTHAHALVDLTSAKQSVSCNQCGKRFTHAHSLSRHMLNHAKQLYKCVVCKASFAQADHLAQHLNSHLANYKRLKP